MNERETWLRDSLQRYLDRRSIPQSLRDKPVALADEAAALVRALNRCAPAQGYRDWWDDFSEKLAEDAQTRAWPTENEIKKAALATPHRRSANPDAAEWSLDPMRINEKRILAGEPVGEDWIWGRRALLLLAKTAVTEEMLENYRDGWFRNKVEAVGEDIANARLAEAQERHRSAIAEHSERPAKRNLPPVKTRGFGA